MQDREFKGNVSPTYAFATQVAEVEVDPDTGDVDLKKVWVAHDCGRAINPLAIEGQIDGQVGGRRLGRAADEGTAHGQGHRPVEDSSAHVSGIGEIVTR